MQRRFSGARLCEPQQRPQFNTLEFIPTGSGSLTNLARQYLPLADQWSILDNRGTVPHLLAEGTGDGARVMDERLFAVITSRRT
jgi:hypothetical protein